MLPLEDRASMSPQPGMERLPESTNSEDPKTWATILFTQGIEGKSLGDKCPKVYGKKYIFLEDHW